MHVQTKTFLTAIIVWLGFFISPVAEASEVGDELRLLGRPMPDSVVLRWAPTSYRMWLVGNKHGYNVARTCLMKDGKFVDNPVQELLTPVPLKPASLEAWEQTAHEDDYAAVAAQAIWGNDFDVEAGEQKGGIIDIVDRANAQESRYGFALLAADVSPAAARLSGLWFTDKTARPGKKYLYKVWPDSVPEGMKPDTAFFFTGVDEHLPVPRPVDVKAEAGDKRVTLTWEKELQDGVFTGFWIERAPAGKGEFKRLNTSILINTTPPGKDEARYHYFTDSLPDNHSEYHYRVVGVTPFGEESTPSDEVKVKGEIRIKTAPRVSAESTPEGVFLEWEMEDAAKNNVEGYRLYRSREFNENYQLLADSLPVMQNKYQDVSPLATGYYRLRAFNGDGNGPLGTPAMAQVIDTIPPAAPVELEASVDTLGHVFLEWAPNGEQDIDGYRVFRGNAEHEEFSQLTVRNVTGNRYVDTINIQTLTKNVFYKLVAVDKRQNWSGFSAILKVERPDVVPPATPRITGITGGEEEIAFEWVLSPSPDVKWQVIYRNRAGSHQWQVVDKLPGSVDAYSDTTVIPETLYRYLVMAVDSAGNESTPGKPSAAKARFSPKSTWVTPGVKFDKRKETLYLTWPEEQTAQYSELRVYRRRGDDENGWKLYKVEPPSTGTIIENVTSQQQFIYKGKFTSF